MEKYSETKAKPFLKWAGGKSQLLSEIEKRFPYGKNDCFSYVEPFVGSGAVLFWILNNYPNVQKVIINDVNVNLIGVYKAILHNVEDLILILEKWQAEFYELEKEEPEKKIYYYKKRELFNSRKVDATESAALVIFLNRTCFNGLYRVNQSNQFNVPMGSYKKPLICDKKNLRIVSEKLKNVYLLNTDFEETLKYVKDEAFFYFDPPYKPLSKTSSFNSYSKAEFNDNEQIRLKNFCDVVHKKNHKWLLSNSDPRGTDEHNEFFDSLYKDYTIERVMANRSINSKAEKRGKLNELLIRNY